MAHGRRTFPGTSFPVSARQYITVGFLERKDVEAPVAFARTTHPSHRIAVVGRSLSGAAALLASPLPIDALVLESVYPTIEETLGNRLRLHLGVLGALASPLLLWQLPPRLAVTPDQLRPIERLASIDQPILIVGGDLDRHATLSETQQRFDAASEPKALAIFQGAAHVDLLTFDPMQHEREVFGFLEQHLRKLRANGQILR